jgi:hypothetical protein
LGMWPTPGCCAKVVTDNSRQKASNPTNFFIEPLSRMSRPGLVFFTPEKGVVEMACEVSERKRAERANPVSQTTRYFARLAQNDKKTKRVKVARDAGGGVGDREVLRLRLCFAYAKHDPRSG